MAAPGPARYHENEDMHQALDLLHAWKWRMWQKFNAAKGVKSQDYMTRVMVIVHALARSGDYEGVDEAAFRDALKKAYRGDLATMEQEWQVYLRSKQLYTRGKG